MSCNRYNGWNWRV